MNKVISFACISPHAPIFLPTIGSKEDRTLAKKTIESLEILGKRLNKTKPDSIIISSPHEDWGFEVPLYFLAKDFKGSIKKVLIGSESPQFYFNKGTEFSNSNYQLPNKSQNLNSKVALIASGDMSHVLKEDGPYGFHPQGPRFDADLIKHLKNRGIERILKLDDDYPEAGECGLRSFCFMLGILEAHSTNSGQAAKIDWKAEILSYEGPFGVGYLTADFKLK